MKTLFSKFPLIFSFSILILGAVNCSRNEEVDVKEADELLIGAYYFDGWAGRTIYADDPNEPWAENAPTHLTRRLAEDFADREPVWGWRDDAQDIMERQIDLAADNGIDFFLFCWYWQDNRGPINKEAIENLPEHTSFKLYLKARNKHRVRFALLVANHEGAKILGAQNWEAAVRHWLPYFNDPQYVTMDGKPLVVLFDSQDPTEDDLLSMQKEAKKRHLPGLSIAGCYADPDQTGFAYRTHYNVVPGYSAESQEQPFSLLMQASKEEWHGTPQQPYIPEITVGWDKRPWEGPRPEGLDQEIGWYYPDRSPGQFKTFLEDAIEWMDQHPDETTKERMILLYAWNELGEGGYLVPTKGDPDGEYLRMVKEVKKNSRKVK